MERLIQKKMVAFHEGHKKLNSAQHGFRAKHSCLTQLLETIRAWAQGLNKGSSTHVVFIDFRKAFDKVLHQRLLLKLDHIGVRGKLLEWVRNFITNRRQHVVINGSYSGWAEVKSGVPQGSILGPLLFLIFINDINCGLNSTTRLFVDDCTIFRNVSCEHDCEALQRDLDLLMEWTQTWQMSLNISKCKVLQITNRRKVLKYPHRLNNIQLEWVNAYNYLGVTIDEKLKWGKHCQLIAGRANKVLSLLKRSMNGCSKLAKAKAYTALVRPHLEYCAPVWSPHTKQDCETLEV